MLKRISLALALLVVSTPSFAGSRWLHVRVDEKGADGDKVRVNIPLSLVEKILPLIEDEEIKGGKVRLGRDDLDRADLKKIWEAVRSTEDAEFVTVQGTRENVRVAKAGSYLVVKATDGSDKDRKETVNVKVPLRVVDALLSGDPDELNLLAAVRALGDENDGDLVSVEGDGDHVRIWVDSQEQER
jgi:hypothetical protein